MVKLFAIFPASRIRLIAGFLEKNSVCWIVRKLAGGVPMGGPGSGKRMLTPVVVALGVAAESPPRGVVPRTYRERKSRP